MVKYIPANDAIGGPRPAARKEEWTLKDFMQELYENGYFRQEEFGFADCDRYQRARVSGLLNKAAAYAGYDYNARGLTHDVLFEMGEV